MSCDPTSPRSYIDSTTAQARKTYYQSSKEPYFTQWIKLHDPAKSEVLLLDFETALVEDVLTKLLNAGGDGVRVYFASYNSYAPLLGKQELLTLVFAPTNLVNGNHVDSGVYYHIDDSYTDLKAVTLPEWKAKEWVKYYQVFKKKYLENAVPALDLKDTECIWHPAEDVQDWLDLIGCAKRGDIPAFPTIQICFAAYSNTDEFKDQLSFYIQMNDAYYNTGNPCPPPRTGCGIAGALLSL